MRLFNYTIFNAEVFFIMPIYEYSCTKCNEIFAVFQSVNAGEKDTTCPKCGSSDVKRKISSFSCCSFDGGTSSPAGSFGGFSGG